MHRSSSAALERLSVTLSHISAPPVERTAQASAISAQPCAELAQGNKRDESLRSDGWGYKDSQFVLNDSGQVFLTGDRYMFSGKVFPNFREWAEKTAGIDMNHFAPAKVITEFPKPVINLQFMDVVKARNLDFSFDGQTRLLHAHGHTCQDVFALRTGLSFPRLPDIVIYPADDEQVQAVVKACNDFSVCIIPFGGGTTVTNAVQPPDHEARMIVSLDMKEMNRILWVDKQSMMACIEAGVVGKDLERKLAAHGVCLGHEPDSIEFSTLGGWIATRASGMKKNVYGNIEDMLIRVRVITPSGVIEKSCDVPRMSSGPDINQMVLGSEGTLGVITQAVLRIRALAETTEYGSILFPDFESGVACLHELAMNRAAPASIRLLDNLQFQFGLALKPADLPEEDDSDGAQSRRYLRQFAGWKMHVIEKLKKFYVTQVKGFDPEKLCAATLMFQGTKAQVAQQQKVVFSTARKYNGMSAGEENGKRGYFMTYMIAYLRDYGMNYFFLAESFETSVPWSQVLPLCHNVKERISVSAQQHGVSRPPFVSCRVTQTYDTGACVYFYFGFSYRGVPNPIETFSKIEEDARDEVLAQGGSLSHHHGVGKLRKKWMQQTVGPVGISLVHAMKKAVDPKNIFVNGNLIDFSGPSTGVHQ